MTGINVSLVIVDNIPRVPSLGIAVHFEKRHERVLDAIRRIIADLPPEFSQHNFVLAEYIDEQGKPRPMYQLTRDAFSLVAMGFTGKKALAWKLRYIEAFNAMEKALLPKPAPKALPAPSPAFDPWTKSLEMHERMIETVRSLVSTSELLMRHADEQMRLTQKIIHEMPH